MASERGRAPGVEPSAAPGARNGNERGAALEDRWTALLERDPGRAAVLAQAFGVMMLTALDELARRPAEDPATLMARRFLARFALLLEKG